MKITLKKLVLGLHEAVEGKSEHQIKNAIKNFVEMLARMNMLLKAEKIREEFEKLWNSKRGIVEAELTSARDLDKETVRLLKKYVSGVAGAAEAILNLKTDKNLLGGIIIRYSDKILDGSMKTRLNELKRDLTK